MTTRVSTPGNTHRLAGVSAAALALALALGTLAPAEDRAGTTSTTPGEELAKTVFAGHQRPLLIGQPSRHVPEGHGKGTDLGRGPSLLRQIDRPVRVEGTDPIGELMEGADNPTDERQTRERDGFPI